MLRTIPKQAGAGNQDQRLPFPPEYFGIHQALWAAAERAFLCFRQNTHSVVLLLVSVSASLGWLAGKKIRRNETDANSAESPDHPRSMQL